MCWGPNANLSWDRNRFRLKQMATQSVLAGENDSCSVCASPFGSKPWWAWKCGHIFHLQCAVQLRYHQHRACPICRCECLSEDWLVLGEMVLDVLGNIDEIPPDEARTGGGGSSSDPYQILVPGRPEQMLVPLCCHRMLPPEAPGMEMVESPTDNRMYITTR